LNKHLRIKLAQLFAVERLTEKFVQIRHVCERAALHNAFRKRGVKIRELHKLLFVGNIRLGHPLMAPDLGEDWSRHGQKSNWQIEGLEKRTF
jgi:hypothetical protein